MRTQTKQCEGWRRHGGAFTLGPVTWKQCTNPATVLLTVEQEQQRQTLPACPICWKEAAENKDIKVIEAKPV